MHQINRIIELNGLKKKWIAEQLNVDLSTFSSWLSGKGQPSFAAMKLLVPILKMDADQVIKQAA